MAWGRGEEFPKIASNASVVGTHTNDRLLVAIIEFQRITANLTNAEFMFVVETVEKNREFHEHRKMEQ